MEAAETVPGGVLDGSVHRQVEVLERVPEPRVVEADEAPVERRAPAVGERGACDPAVVLAREDNADIAEQLRLMGEQAFERVVVDHVPVLPLHVREQPRGLAPACGEWPLARLPRAREHRSLATHLPSPRRTQPGLVRRRALPAELDPIANWQRAAYALGWGDDVDELQRELDDVAASVAVELGLAPA